MSRHGPLRNHSTRTRALEGRITEIGTQHPERPEGDDAVHFDFHPGNILASDGTITGVVDWGGACRGDRRLDLVTLRFGVHNARVDPGVVERLDTLLDIIPDSVLAPMWAHVSLRMLDWAIRHFTDQAVGHWLHLAEQRIHF